MRSKELKDRIKFYLKKTGMTQSNFAEALGLKYPQQLNRWLNHDNESFHDKIETSFLALEANYHDDVSQISRMYDELKANRKKHANQAEALDLEIERVGGILRRAIAIVEGLE